MSRTLKIFLLLNLAVLAVLTFAFAELMVSPGKLITGHQQLEKNCFKCHVAFKGISAEKCMNCHKAIEIGRVTTTGKPVTKARASTPFHQELISQDCTACHSDHAGVKPYHLQGSFKHELLKKEANEKCHACHKAPVDLLHKKIVNNCGQCHTQKKWTPADFDHDKYFVLDRDHNASCVTCHTQNDYRRFTCYGCHEHTLANVRREHIEEGINQFENCAECHRSAEEDEAKGREKEARTGNRRD